LWPGAEAGVLIGGNLALDNGTDPTPPSAGYVEGTFHAAFANDHLGIFAQGGGQKDSRTQQWTPIGAVNFAGTIAPGPWQLYLNAIVNASGANQIAGKPVGDNVSLTGLFGVTLTPREPDPTPKDPDNLKPGPNTFGAEVSITGNKGMLVPPSSGSVSSTTYTALVFYQRAAGPVALGFAAGVSYEDSGGGTTAFVRFGIAWDHPRILPIPTFGGR
jgi:hypothetical protein